MHCADTDSTNTVYVLSSLWVILYALNIRIYLLGL